MMLLLLVAATVSAASLEPALPKGHRIVPVPVHVYGPEVPGLFGPASQRRDYLERILYTYRYTPSEVNIRHKGQNPITYQVPAAQRFEPKEQAFSRGHIEAFPGQEDANVVPYYQNRVAFEEDPEFLRDAVEHVPIEALPYMAEYEPEEDAVFSRGDVESYPHFPTPYSGGFEDEGMDAYVIETPQDMYGWAGYRAAVESPPLKIPTHDPEEAKPVQPQLNSRPFGPWSETLLSQDVSDDDDDVVEVGGPNSFVDTFSSLAGADLWKYYNDIRSQKSDYKLVCYYGGWSVYRPEPFDFTVTDIDPFSCTHVIYSFAGLKANEYTIQALDEETDIVKGAYKAAVGLKNQNPALKVMIAIGGWNEGGKKYSEMASSKQRREKFVASVVSFLQEHKFDGLDLDWEYPGASDRGGRWSDKANFADLVEELAAAFQPHGWILSAAVSPAKFRVNEGYDVPRLAQHLDFINIMTYDLRGPWDGKADHHAPISARPSDSWAYKALNTKDGIAYWAEKGAPKEKLLMGIPFYGRTFTLASSDTQPGARAKSGGNEGQYTQERGFLAYYEVCQEMRNGGWDMQEDAVGGPYMSKGDQWIGWDDVDYVNKKMELVKSEGLGGAMVWAIDLDDYLGVCGDKWPLLTAMRRGLGLSALPSTPGAIPINPPAETSTTAAADTTKVTTAATTVEETMPEQTATQTPFDTEDMTTLPPTTLTPTESTPAPNFTCPGPGFFRSAEDCAVYFLCDSSLMAYKFVCPAGLVFDTLRRLCNWPRHVKCGAASSPLRVCTEPNQKFCLPGQSVMIEGSDENEITLKMAQRAGSENKVVCYFTSWAYYRPAPHNFAPEYVDPNLCTHIIYAYAMLDGSELIMRSLDPYLDFDYKFYQRILALKREAPNVRVMLALGGWVDSTGDKYSRLVNNPKARANFVEHTTQVLTAYRFDGLDFGWMYPRCWQMDCSKGPASDVSGFASLIKELKMAFARASPPLLLSAAVSPARNTIDRAYDVPTLSRYLDFINVMTYDFHGAWERETGHVSPLTFRDGDRYASQNTDYSMKHWVERGADPSKLVMGIPFYGQTFTLANPLQNGLRAPVSKNGDAGPVTRQRGMMAYFEICKIVRTPGWSKVVDAKGAIGPFAHKGDQWYSYEDPDSVTRKANYILSSGYGGAMVWDLSFDDLLNDCCRESMPLLRSINRVLRSVPYPPPRPGGGDCSRPPVDTTPPTPARTTTYASDTIQGKPTESTWGLFNLTSGSTTKSTPSWQTPWTPTTPSPRPPTTRRTTSTTSTTQTTPRTTSPWWVQPSTSTTPRTTTWWWRPPTTTTTTRMPITRTTTPTTTTTTTTTRRTTTTSRRPIYTTTTPRPKPQPAPPAPGGGKNPGESCRSGEYHPKAGDCGYFLRCSNGVLEEARCAPGLHWNQAKKICDWPQNANCGKQPSGPATTPPPFLPPSTTTTAPWWTTRSTARPTTRPTTRPWWQPSQRPTYPTTRPPTTTRPWWQPPTRSTSRPWWQSTRSTFLSSSTTTTAPPATRPSPPSPSESGEESCDPGQTSGVPGDCSSFRQCHNGDWVVLSCAPGLHWNERLKICDWPQRARCRSTATTRGPDMFKKSTCTTEGEAYAGPQCTALVRCAAGQLVVQHCTGGLVWNNEQAVCDFPSNVPKCSGVTLTPASEALRPAEVTGSTVSSKLTTPSIDVSLPCNEGSYIRDPKDCSSYMLCVHGEWQKFSCQPPLQWDQNKRICDWPSNVKCTPSDAGTVSQVGVGTVPTQASVGGSVTRPTPPPPPPPSVELEPVGSSGALSGDYMVVCYFTNWAWYRPGEGKYKPEDIDPTICTHIVYGFAVLDYSNLIIKPHDTWADFDNKFYEKVTALKAKGIKVTIAIGGWNDSAGDKYSRLVNNPAARSKFITHVVEFIKKHNFDGLDLDWEYPVCWQVDCKKGPPSDKEAFAMWVKELSAAFKPHGLLLSAAVSPSKKVIDAGYDVPTLSQYMDWIAVMTYDFHGHWDKKTGHVAPMYYHPEDDYDYFNMDFAIRYWIEKGAAKNKLVLGMPLYGQSFSINDPKNTGLNSPARSGGQAGPFTRARGFLAYYEICHFIQQGWTVVTDPEGRMGPYAYSGNQWVSFDDVETIRRKSQYIREMGLAGGMVWALDLDDFRNRCGQGAHPLMNTIKAVLGPPKGAGDASVTGTVAPPPVPVPENTTPMSRVPTPTQPESVQPSGSGDYKVVCYFTNWAWYRPGEGKYTPDDIDASLCTHIVYGFAVLNGNNLLIKPHDTWADFDNKFYERVTALRAQGVKVLVAIGGWNDSAGNKYSRLVNDPAARAKFNEHVIQFIQQNNFDGLDLDWEYPVCWQVNCNKGPASDKDAFSAWVRELKVAFEPHGLLLSAAVSPSNKVIDAGYDVPVLSQYLDWIAVMTYDYHGQWDKKTGHVAPMYAHSTDENLAFNTNFTIHYWIEKGAERKKLVLGMPMYGQSFTLASSQDNGLLQKSYGGGEAGRYTRARGFLAYYEICYKIRSGGWTVVRDSEGTMGPYAYKGNQWVGFDDVHTIRYKSEYIKKMGLGGGMIWALDLDDFRNRCDCETHPLLRTINRVLRNIPVPDPGCPLLGGAAPTMGIVQPGITVVREETTTAVAVMTSPPPKPNTVAPGPSRQTECQTGESRGHPTNCNIFYVCVFGKFEEKRCHAGLHWNGKDRCDWPDNAGCSGGSSSSGPSPPESTAAPTPTSTTTNPWWPRPTTTSKPTTTTIATHIETIIPDTGYKVVCYFTNWAWYRQSAGKYRPEDIDPHLCTHIVYGFAVLDGTRLLIKPHDTWADYDNKFYEKVTALRARGIKVTIAIGGWNDSAGDKYSRLVNNPEARRRFNEHVIEFIKTHNFDGLDLDWEYPVCWQVNCKKGPASDKAAFAEWIKELHYAFKPHGLLLSAAVSPSNKVIDAGYDVPALNRYLDWIAVMTYDYHGHWDKKTGHVAPMYVHPDDENIYFNSNFTIHYWMEKGADRKKLIMGMPLYGQSFSLASASDNGLNQKAYGRGTAGEYTRAGGFLAYYEICDRVLNRGFTVVKDPEGRMGPYAYNGNQWFGYDDIAMIRYKSEWVKKMGLGGGMIWALDLDDFSNRCGCEPHPLLRTINRVLRSHPDPDPRCNM
nr:probable chitinase 10 isoform X3 [Penaeus vannamei]